MTKKIDRTVELVLRLESAARMSTGEEARDFKDAAHRLGTYAAACQGFSKDLADIAEENARLKAAIVYVYTRGYRAGHHDTVEGGFVDVRQSEETTYFAEDANTALSEVPR